MSSSLHCNRQPSQVLTTLTPPRSTVLRGRGRCIVCGPPLGPHGSLCEASKCQAEVNANKTGRIFFFENLVNQTVSLLLARAMWDCPIPMVMTASSSQLTTGASWRKTGRSECKSQFPPLLLAGSARGRACDSADVLTRLAQGGEKHTFMVAEHVVALSVCHNGFVAR